MSQNKEYLIVQKKIDMYSMLQEARANCATAQNPIWVKEVHTDNIFPNYLRAR